MMELNNVKANEAWEDYKAFLEGLGVSLNQPHNAVVTRQLQQAFKMGFAYGKASKQESQEKTELETKPRATGRRRTDKELAMDAQLVKSILQRHRGAMRLKDIVEAVNGAGGDWYEKSATNHMAKVMERVPAIKKVGFGLYEYQQ